MVRRAAPREGEGAKEGQRGQRARGQKGFEQKDKGHKTTKLHNGKRGRRKTGIGLYPLMSALAAGTLLPSQESKRVFQNASQRAYINTIVNVN